MGAEAEVRARVKGKADRGRALLETNEVIFRGAQRCVVKLDAVRAKASAAGGWLKLSPDLELELGAQAEKWLQKIKNPKSVLQKLGVKKGQVATLIGEHDEAFARELESQGLSVERSLKKNAELVFALISSRDALSELKKLRRALADDGALWLLRPKGKNAPVGELEVRAAGLKTGLVDVKVVGFSETLSAEKYVVPLAKRK
jgi:hypothetical protein